MGRSKFKKWNPEISNKIPSPSPSPEDASSSSLPPPPPPPWTELPEDVTANILRRLGTEGMLESAQKVCTTWRKVCQDPSMWRVIYLRNPEHFYDLYNIMCSRAVDLAQGQLIDLSIEYFGDEKLIDYIANRSSNLKRLTLRGCYDIYGDHLIRAVENLRELEALHLTIMPSVSAEEVRILGLSCPKLKSFSYNGRGLKHPHINHVTIEDFIDESHQYDYALAISIGMHNLHHLQLFAQWIPNRSLEAILDACPHLKSLDLRQCYDLDLSGDLGKRCREQIKDLRLPLDSASDIQHLVGGPSDWDDNGIYDVESIDSLSDSDYYFDYEGQYDDYLCPVGYEFFADDGFVDDDDVGGFFYHGYL